MSESPAAAAAKGPREEAAAVALLLAAFFLSGAAGLVYETVWVRMLTRFLGSTTAAVSTVLAVFMAGLALGSLLAGRWADRLARPVRAYALLEFLLAGTALAASLLVISGVGGMYVALARTLPESRPLLLVLRVAVAVLCLLPPSLLMGATLPVLTAFVVRRTRFFQGGLGRLYALNTLGAVLGVLAAGYVLLGAVGERGTVLAACACNLAAGALAWGLERGRASDPPACPAAPAGEGQGTYLRPQRRLALAALFVSGFTALGYEVVWTRLLLLPLRTSIYSFSFMLALFLLGIGLGSILASRPAWSASRPLARFGMLELAVALASALGLALFTVLGSDTMGFSTGLGTIFLASVCTVLPPAVFFGWQFPVAVRCALSGPDRPGRETGQAYLVNTLGAILGSLAAGFALIPLLGAAGSMRLLMALNAAMGLALLAAAPAAERRGLVGGGLAMALLAAAVMVLAGDPYREVLDARLWATFQAAPQVLAMDEGVSGTTTLARPQARPGEPHLFINGVSMTALSSETKVMAHLPLELVSNPRDMLVICFGMGTTVRSAARSPKRLERIDAVDIMPYVFTAFPFFHADAAQVLADPRVRLHAEDGRNFLLLQDRTWDVITIDPAPPLFSAGSVNLYTREFLALCRQRITPGGVVCLWLPPSPSAELLMIMKTFVGVFPGASLWGGFEVPGFYLLGGRRDLGMEPAGLQAVAQRLAGIPDLGEWRREYRDPAMVSAMYLLGPEEFAHFVDPWPQVTDDRPHTEFPLWRSGVFRFTDVLDAVKVRAALPEIRAAIARNRGNG